MADVEGRIREALMVVDTTDLDRRIDHEITAFEVRGEAGRRVVIPWWFTAAACIVCAFVGLVAGRMTQACSENGETPTMVVIEVSPEFERWLTSQSASMEPENQTRVYDGVEAVYVAGRTGSDL